MLHEAVVMSSGLIVRTGALGGSKLSRAIRSGEVGQNWYAARPVGIEEWRRHAQHVRENFANRNWLDLLSAAFGFENSPHSPAYDRLRRAAESGIVVTTGQQPGLFGGPIYTWSKALSALALADELEKALNVPVAPVFWAATDDTDWLEASETWFAVHTGLVKASIAAPPREALSMNDVPLTHMQEPLAQLLRACGSGANASVLNTVKEAYRETETVGSAFLHLLRSLLEPLGIAVLDAAHPSTRLAADSFLRSALKNSGKVHHAVEQRIADIRSAGFSPQVESVPDLSLVFLSNSNGTRQRVSLRDAEHVAESAPKGALGANVLLRPVLERHLLPTACYLAGPGEFAYFAQVTSVAEALGAQVPVVAPRWAAELVEESVITLRDQLHVSDTQLRDGHAAAGAIAREKLDQSVAKALQQLRALVDAQVDDLRAALYDSPAVSGEIAPEPVAQHAILPALPDSVVDGLKNDINHRINRFERRLLAAVKHRETEAMRELESLRAAIVPNGKPAERVLNIVPLLVRYGVGILEQMRDAARVHANQLILGQATEPVKGE